MNDSSSIYSHYIFTGVIGDNEINEKLEPSIAFYIESHIFYNNHFRVLFFLNIFLHSVFSNNRLLQIYVSYDYILDHTANSYQRFLALDKLSYSTQTHMSLYYYFL